MEAEYKHTPNRIPLITLHKIIGRLIVFNVRPLKISPLISVEYKNKTFLDETNETKVQKILMIKRVTTINPIATFSTILALVIS